MINTSYSLAYESPPENMLKSGEVSPYQTESFRAVSHYFFLSFAKTSGGSEMRLESPH